MKTTKRILLILCAMFMASQPVLAQNDEDTRNKAVITTDDGDRQLITDEISVIRFDGPKVTVVQPWGDTVFDRTLRSLTFLRPLPGTLRLTVNLNTDEDAGSTRGHSIDGNGYLASTWSENDRVYVYADAATTTSLGTLKPATTGGQVSKMTGDITATNLTNGQKLYLSTQPRTHIFASQTGDVEDAAMFYLTAESTVTINGGNATTANATFQMAQAVLKVTLKDGSNNDVSVKSLVITGSTETITVTPTPATNVLYVAMPASASTVYSLTATDNNNREWTGSKTAKLDNKYYTTTVTMTKTMLNPVVTAPTAKALTYTGSEQALVDEGSTTGGTLYYMATSTSTAPAINAAEWATTVPEGTDATTYYVWTKVTGDADYNDVGVSATSVEVTISPKPVTISGITANNKTYDGTIDATLVYPTITTAMGLVESDNLTVTATGTFDDANVGTGKTVTISGLTLGGASVANYVLAGEGQQTSTTADIAKATYTVSGTASATDVYGTQVKDIAISGLTVKDVSNTDVAGAWAFTSTEVPSVGNTTAYTATFNPSVADANYNALTQEITPAITPAAASVTTAPAAVGDALTYNGSAQTLFSTGSTSDGTLMYKVTTDDTKPTSTDGFSATIEQQTDAGTYYLWYYVVGNANHNDTEINTTGISMSIGKKSLTVTADAKSKDYGTENPALTYTHGDLATADDESVFTGALACAATTASEPGEYDITQGTLSAGENYEISYTGAKLTVNLLDMSSGVTVTPYNAAYDGNPHGITIVLSEAAEGATITYCDTENGTYQAENYTYTDVAAARTVWYKIEKEHYTTITGSSTVTITQASNSFTTQPTITGWTYGESANAPTGGVASYGTSTITYKYCATENGEYGTYDAIVNGQAGTWFVKGFVEATTNYAAATSNAISFTISAAAGSISYAPTPVEKTLAAPAFTNSLTKVGDGTVTYALTSGDEICTVNASTGEVTLNGTPGSCIITATVINGTNYSYDTHTANYTLTVLPVLDLSMVTANTTVPHGVTVTGTLGGNYKISIADGATVTLSDVTINGVNNGNYGWAGLNCEGNATINLADGTTNTVKGFHENYPGIHVPSTKTLTIQGMGTLNASSNGKGAGIGGGRNISCGIIIINGGIITASGGSYAAGIGSGGDLNGSPNCGDITINGGTIMATGGSRGAGIGSAFGNGSCGNITISGGIVTATGGTDGGAGIGGGGYNGRCGDITISGGEVTATGGGGDEGATGIGSGRQSSYNSITISGGTVIANGGTNGAGIGTGYCANGGDILISGGTVTATGSGNYSVGIGAGYGSNYHCGNITIENTVTRVTATKSANAVHSIGICYNGRSNCGTVSIGGNVGAISTSPYTYSPAIDLATISSNYTAQDHDILTGTLGSNVQISVAAGARITLRNATISSGNYAGLTCLGSATITLQGSNTMTGAWAKAGIQIGGTGTTLTIEGPGSLQANGGGQSAGIGIGRAWNAGTVTGGNIVINGGTVTAQGGSQWGAGIGTGAAYTTAVTIGNITINGGEVTATGGSDGGAAGIGTSYTYSNASTNMGNITINGGTVNATGNGGAAGIGTGESNGSPVNKVGSITIINTVTRVTATKGPNATHSIGKGASSSGFGTVTLVA